MATFKKVKQSNFLACLTVIVIFRLIRQIEISFGIDVLVGIKIGSKLMPYGIGFFLGGGEGGAEDRSIFLPIIHI